MQHLRALAIDALGLVAPRSVAIQDWRLLISLQALRGLVAFYVLYSLINGKTYLQQEVPHGTISNIGTSTEYFDGLVDKHAFHASGDGATTIVTASNGVSRTFDLMPCSDATAIDAAYKFNRSFGFEFDHLMCAFLDSDELVREFPSGGIFVTTHVYYKLVYRNYLSGGSAATCAADTSGLTVGGNPIFTNEGVPHTVPLRKKLGDVCYYSKEFSYLPVAPEAIEIRIDHTYDTASGVKAGTNPPVYVRRAGSDVDIKTFAAGESVRLTVEEILEAVGVDLDKRYAEIDSVNELFGQGVDAANTPKIRTGGMRVIAKMLYYNYNLDGKRSATGSHEPYAVLELTPRLAWTTLGQDVTHRVPSEGELAEPVSFGSGNSGRPKDNYYSDWERYGIYVEVSSAGIIATFNLVYFVNVLVSGLVLFGVSQILCILMATTCFGARSKMYSRMLYERTHFERNIAAYGVQAIIAAQIFKNSGKTDALTVDDLTDLLESAFSQSKDAEKGANVVVDAKRAFSRDELKQMAYYIIRSGNFEAVEKYQEKRLHLGVDEVHDKTINMNEFIDLATSGAIDVPLVKSIIHSNGVGQIEDSTPSPAAAA